MKIEIGESLVRTWIRHCRGCQLAELNWKPSPRWPGKILPEHEEWFNSARDIFPPNTLKKTTSVSQFLRQAEIDVLGVRLEKGKAAKVIAADIAFHAGGLNYGSKDETVARVAKKHFRTTLTLDVHFPGIPAEIVFLAPKVNNSVIQGLEDAEEKVRAFFNKRRDYYSFRTIINSGFRTEIIDEVAPLAKIVADTSELYLRAVQLQGLPGTPNPLPGPILPENPPPGPIPPQKVNIRGIEISTGRSGNRTKEYFFDVLPKLIEVMSEKEIQQLQDVDFCKSKFRLAYPVITENSADVFDSSEHRRFYSKPLRDKYYVCNDWYEKNFKLWAKYLEEMESGLEL